MTLEEAGIGGRHMMYISGHKSESTIKEYTNKVPDKKKRQMYAILADGAGYPAPKVVKTKLNSTVTQQQEEQQSENVNLNPQPMQVPAVPHTLNNGNPTFDLSNIDLLEFDEKQD